MIALLLLHYKSPVLKKRNKDSLRLENIKKYKKFHQSKSISFTRKIPKHFFPE